MLERYKRQIILPEIGTKGQERLSASKALVVGTGGLGSPVLYYLTAAGVGHIHIMDSDTVEITNLNRQFLHFEQDIGSEKSRSAKNKLTQFNGEIEVSASTIRLKEENVQESIAGYDIVISCVDNVQTRILLNKNCVQCGIPLVDGGAQGFNGYIMLVLPGITPCYHCIFPEAKQEPGSIGVLGATAGVIGSIMAAQAIKYLIGTLNGFEFLYVDLSSLSFTSIQAKRNPTCPVCGKGNK
jgi:molybdopterin/thiamine biosynthesis adenylyltransferase